MASDSITFLVVEDSPTMRQLISFSLKRFEGCRIVEAVDGVDALKKLSTDKVDMILTDINMPVMDGHGLVKLLRRNEKTRHIPIIVITTEGAEKERAQLLRTGANAFISKPIQSSKLIRTITALMTEQEIGH
jgi:two-component system chemotaxis response regulator CheY